MVKLEYIWIDGTEPTPQLRSKTKVIKDFGRNIGSCPEWGFDGSSTNQADGHSSDCVLKPVRLYPNPLEKNCYLVLCEVWGVDGNLHPSNHRFKLDELNSKHKYKDVIFQDDRRPSKPNVVNVCAGFMLIRSNSKMKNFFNPENLPSRLFHKYKTHDQTYINKSKSKFNYSMLSLDEFPNGPRFYAKSKDLNPYIIHFNYISGEEKIKLMRDYKEWYL